MKTLLGFMFVLVSALTSVSHAAGSEEWIFAASCMQTTTNDGSLPNNVSIYTNAQGISQLLLKFYIGNDPREVIATQTGRESAGTVQFDDVRLFEDGAVKGGRMGIKFNMDLGVFQNGGNMTWKYFDGSAASYVCAPF
ncbi:hypothetical protein [Bdellovibrio sp. KM01]|uniref:hypothetical protein n=1 Tax=Bdellovibrio sp. KM01 TaxID=2748865 RepID=UPI0015EA565F|nr:hypothetical protein [Bdellovibrio sp. KM01]QLY26439.1 hypothetical protein HW988_05280 [Bdellovibrio sp. KM01]